MKDELFLYKSRFISILLLVGFAYMHTQLTGTYDKASLDKLIHGTAPLPFGQRLLVPQLARLLSNFLPFSIEELFFLLELLFISLLFLSMNKLLRLEFNKRWALLLSWLFLLVLPLMYIINYRYTSQGVATFFYPSDSASQFFITLGFYLCLQKNWLWFAVCVFVATLNRESSIILVLLVPTIYSQHIKQIFKPLVLALTAYTIARMGVILYTLNLPGSYAEIYRMQSDYTHFETNIHWLLNNQNLLLFPYCMACLPLFWFGFYDYIPQRFKPIRYLALFYFLGLFVVGNFVEARIFNEILVLLYYPICLGISAWLQEKKYPMLQPNSTGLLYYLNRYAVMIILALVCLANSYINIWLR